jgi:hypothetical protein
MFLRWRRPDECRRALHWLVLHVFSPGARREVPLTYNYTDFDATKLYQRTKIRERAPGYVYVSKRCGVPVPLVPYRSFQISHQIADCMVSAPSPFEEIASQLAPGRRHLLLPPLRLPEPSRTHHVCSVSPPPMTVSGVPSMYRCLAVFSLRRPLEGVKRFSLSLTVGANC